MPGGSIGEGEMRLDVNLDGRVTAVDALGVINELGRRSGSEGETTDLEPSGVGESRHPADVNGNGKVTALDALLVINTLQSAEGQSTGQQPAALVAQPVSSQPEGEGVETVEHDVPVIESAEKIVGDGPLGDGSDHAWGNAVDAIHGQDDDDPLDWATIDSVLERQLF